MVNMPLLSERLGDYLKRRGRGLHLNCCVSPSRVPAAGSRRKLCGGKPNDAGSRTCSDNPGCHFVLPFQSLNAVSSSA